jgi:hypothetical protein
MPLSASFDVEICIELAQRQPIVWAHPPKSRDEALAVQGRDRNDQCYIPYSPRFLGIQRDVLTCFMTTEKASPQGRVRGGEGGHIEHHTEKKSG